MYMYKHICKCVCILVDGKCTHAHTHTQPPLTTPRTNTHTVTGGVQLELMWVQYDM
jgi:hypothetical protein